MTINFGKMKRILFKLVFEKAFVFLCLIGALVSCRQNTDPEHIVDKAIEAHGGRLFENVQIEFDFRERSYSSHRQEGLYTYTRAFTDTAGQVKDILDNEGFKRFINGRLAQVSDERARAYSSSVNSTVYFALLPFGLDDPAVRKEFVGETIIKGKPYYKVRVTFDPEGGGDDFEDVFLYWFNQKTFTMDYLAYSFQNEDGGGLRFREAYNARNVNGIFFQDYINYKPKEKDVTLDQMEDLFKSGDLVELSRIDLHSISVKPIQ